VARGVLLRGRALPLHPLWEASEGEEVSEWTVSICRLHNAPLFQPQHGCDCVLDDTVSALVVHVVHADEREKLVKSLASERERRRQARAHRARVVDVIEGVLDDLQDVVQYPAREQAGQE
jgi:hypothetical protein